ncbi:hypothetical protein AOLI_G00318590 [Acnodon oligacanthus]
MLVNIKSISRKSPRLPVSTVTAPLADTSHRFGTLLAAWRALDVCRPIGTRLDETAGNRTILNRRLELGLHVQKRLELCEEVSVDFRQFESEMRYQDGIVWSQRVELCGKH